MLSSFSVTLSIAFYIFTFIMGKRKERVQDIPNDLMPPQPAADDADDTIDTVMNISPDEPNTSKSFSNNSKILNSKNDSLHSDDDTDDDDDDQILPIQNTNLIEIGE